MHSTSNIWLSSNSRDWPPPPGPYPKQCWVSETAGLDCEEFSIESDPFGSNRVWPFWFWPFWFTPSALAGPEFQVFGIDAQSVSTGLMHHSVIRNGPDKGGIACAMSAFQVGVSRILQCDPAIPCVGDLPYPDPAICAWFLCYGGQYPLPGSGMLLGVHCSVHISDYTNARSASVSG